ncbi:DNA-directed RNA polymerase, mitochondrial [Platichthys flesus]|uniref:DNA-directed RNA polymerase, mitochondrial n=1 Tax=Platichthys flesus TaxID=8260 RepID=UPI002DBD1A75|nr:DNA-directed RNA polymerase, mitochondrial [Platichthys flesus]
MSVLRVCALAKSLSRRSLLEKCALRGYSVDCCRLCASLRSGAVRRISETPLQLQRRNVSFVIPKKEAAKKRVLEQSQLFDVLEARIQQLRTDIVLDIQHAELQVVKAGSSGRGASSSWGPKSTSKEKIAILNSGAKGTSKPQQSRWTEKLALEKKENHKIQQKVKQTDKRKPTTKSKGSKSSSQILPGTSHKTISAAAKKTIPAIQTNRGCTKLSDKSHAAAYPKAASTASTAHYVSKGKWKDSKIQHHGEKELNPTDNDAQSKATELAEVEKLERRLSQQANQSTSSSVPERPQVDSEERACGDMQMSIRSYLEACVFVGDIDRASHFLLSQHRVIRRRKLMNTDIYNILMRVWAKKSLLHQIGRIFILLEEAGLKPNLGSYCAVLECMGRSPSCTPKVVTRCLKQMQQDGLSVDDVFSQCMFRQDEKDMVLKAIRIVQPDYQPCLKLTTNEGYTSLVQDFYTQRKDHHYPKLVFTQDQLLNGFKRQLDVEQACTVTIPSVEADKPVTKNMAKMRALLAEQRAQWQKSLLQALRETKTILASTNTRDYRLNLYPHLCLLEDREYVDIMIQSVANLPPSGDSLKILAGDLGNRIYTKYSVRQKHQNQMVEKLSKIYCSYTDLLAKDTKEYDVLPREHWCNLEMELTSGPMLQGGETSWPYIVTLELGTCLVDMMVKNLKINSDILNPAQERKRIPVLYHMYTFRSIRQIGFIKLHPILSQMQQEAMETKLTFDSYVMPMLCPPVPWTSVKFGAYLLTPAKLMRTVDGAIQHEVLLEKCQNLHAVLDSLNQLGSCAWRINKPLLDIIISIFNDRGNDKLDVPPPLSEAPKLPHFNPQDPNHTASEKAHMRREVIMAKKKYSEMHSLRMDALYKLSIANHMRDDIFWFPHNMDFRGRTYPCPPYFNHLGSDVTRAILLFAEGKPLGPKGLDWLKIHLVNLTGLKKRSSLQGRLEYANTIMEDILDSADNPLNGKKWWMNADEPWQALACCMEIATAMRSPDPAQFISNFPVHQDGSCNGLQHYAALGRDVIGATSVNLLPCDVPQDVYSGVAQQVEEFRAEDAESGVKIAKVLEGFISRKVVKQTVMTVVYGVTRYGGRLQIEKRLKEIDDFPKEHVWDASHYLVRLVFTGLKEMFTGTREIQDWLTESARLISKSGHTVEWVTPLGLPVIQPYHRTRNQMMKSIMQHINLKINHDIKERPDTVKQKNAFPPNFIHSLDSTHMMLTSLHCYSAGLTFVSVHDCFWTHALTVDTMNKVCREQFVALHSQPILEDLSNFLLQKYCNRLQPEAKNKKYQEYRRLLLLLAKVPQTGDFDLEQVKESTYFFS